MFVVTCDGNCYSGQLGKQQQLVIYYLVLNYQILTHNFRKFFQVTNSNNLLAGFSNYNYSLLGGLRAVALTISYEVSLALILFFIFLIGSYNLLIFLLFSEIYTNIIFDISFIMAYGTRRFNVAFTRALQ